MNCRHGLLVVLMAMVAAWCSPMVAFSQVPTFGRLDAVEGMPKCLHEVNPGVYLAGELVLSNTPYFVWVADKKVGRTHEQASWRRFGPFTLEGGKRYVFVRGSIVGNTRATNVTVSPGLASLHFENQGSVPTWITVNPLPPGCGPNVTESTGANLAKNRPARQSSIYTGSYPSGAQGGVDGVKNGKFGFHTKSEPNPSWWQVDLGEVKSLTEIRIFNRLDCCSELARTIQILLSNDEANWTRVFTNNGSVFGGSDGKPLKVSLKGKSARYVRLQLAEKNNFHLDEVEIY
jgi:hypothetical protein